MGVGKEGAWCMSSVNKQRLTRSWLCFLNHTFPQTSNFGLCFQGQYHPTCMVNTKFYYISGVALMCMAPMEMLKTNTIQLCEEKENACIITGIL